MTSPIPCEEIVARAIDPREVTALPPRTVRKSAFIPRASGQDNDGLSVTLARPGALHRLRERLQRPNKEAVTLHVGRVREISAGAHQLDVKSDPIEGDADHALITGFPPRQADESDEHKAIWNRLAELLARQARCCLKS